LLFIGPFILVPRIAAAFLILFWFLIQFLSGILSLGATTEQTSGVAVWAHIGGFIGGLILLEIMRPRRSAAVVAY
jgi:membrane associated rhomboid family serine protease